MRILLTGATGFIGSWLTPRLQQDKHSLIAVVRNTTDTTRLEASGITIIRDTDIAPLESALRSKGPIDGVVHLASFFQAAHQPADVEPMVAANVLFPARILQAAVDCGVRWFINTGTAWQHFSGDESYSPVNLYAATKQAYEDIARYYVEAHNLQFLTLALSDTYGPGDTRRKLLNLWCQTARTGTPLDMSDGKQQISLVYASDVAEAFAHVINGLHHDQSALPLSQTYNVVSNEIVSIRELATLFESTTGIALPLRWGMRPKRQREVVVPWQGGIRIPGWHPVVSLSTGIARLWSSYP